MGKTPHPTPYTLHPTPHTLPPRKTFCRKPYVSVWRNGDYTFQSRWTTSYFTGDCLKTDLHPVFGLTSPTWTVSLVPIWI